MGQSAFPAYELILDASKRYTLPSANATAAGCALVDQGVHPSQAGTRVLGWTSGEVALKGYVDSGLAGKASTSHTHEISDIIGLSTSLGLKSNIGHVHAISDITGLQSAIDAKQDILVSGGNIKTINGLSVLGNGDISIAASPGGSSGALQYNNGGSFAGVSGSSVDGSGNVSFGGHLTIAIDKAINTSEGQQRLYFQNNTNTYYGCGPTGSHIFRKNNGASLADIQANAGAFSSQVSATSGIFSKSDTTWADANIPTVSVENTAVTGNRTAVVKARVSGGYVSSQPEVWVGAENSYLVNGSYIRTVSNHPMYFRTNDTDRMTIAASGSVQIHNSLSQQSTSQTSAIKIQKDSLSGYGIVSLDGGTTASSMVGITGSSGDGYLYAIGTSGVVLRQGGTTLITASTSGIDLSYGATAPLFTAGSGSNGRAVIAAGDATRTGYLEWKNPSNVRTWYMGYDSDNNLSLTPNATSYIFKVAGTIANTSTVATGDRFSLKDDGGATWTLSTGGVANTDGFRITKVGTADIVAFRPSIIQAYTNIATTGTIQSAVGSAGATGIQIGAANNGFYNSGNNIRVVTNGTVVSGFYASGFESTGFIGLTTGSPGSGISDIHFVRNATGPTLELRAAGGVKIRDHASADAPLTASNGVFSGKAAIGYTATANAMLYINDMQGSSYPSIHIDKFTWGSPISLSWATESPGITSVGSGPIISHALTITNTALSNAFIAGGGIDAQCEYDQPYVTGIRVRGRKTRTDAPTHTNLAYGIYAIANSGKASGLGGAAGYFLCETPNVAGVQIKAATSQAQPTLLVHDSAGGELAKISHTGDMTSYGYTGFLAANGGFYGHQDAGLALGQRFSIRGGASDGIARIRTYNNSGYADLEVKAVTLTGQLKLPVDTHVISSENQNRLYFGNNTSTYYACGTGGVHQFRQGSGSTLGSIEASSASFSGYVTSAFQTLSTDPSALDLASGFARVIKNTSTGSTALWVNSTGTPEKADSSALSVVSVDGVTITGNGTPGSPLVASGGGGGGGSSSIPTLMSW